MTKDILKLSATLLGLDDVIEHLKSGSSVSQETQNKIDDLITYLNYTLREITKEYFPLKHTEITKSDNQCQIFFTNLSETAISIKDIKDQFGNSVTFNLYPEFIKLGFPNSNYTIEYNYVPKSVKNINDTLTLPLGLEMFSVCYGIASEYALSRLLYSEAEMWESKFKNSLQFCKNKLGERRFYARRLK